MRKRRIGCSFPGCEKPHSCKGMCAGHYRQSRKTGVLRPLGDWPRRLSISERFASKIAPGAKGCVIWTGAKSVGYGIFSDNGVKVFAHRWNYERVNGPIPAGKVIDHLCRVPSCVNPSHLEVVSQQENTLRGIGPSSFNAQKTHCMRGHEFAGENMTVIAKRRVCVTCRRQRDRARDARLREAARRSAA